jgi:HSF-type DNA-binding
LPSSNAHRQLASHPAVKVMVEDDPHSAPSIGTRRYDSPRSGVLDCDEHHDGSMLSENSKEATDKHNSHTKGKEPILFPVKLFSILERMEADGVADVAAWQPHGRSFIIRKPKEFVSLLPVYLPGINKIKSFQRQVRHYFIHMLHMLPTYLIIVPCPNQVALVRF